ncbi:hypothetical protein RHGRI_003340 [Rhododendron griersonianum]|uniref:Ubiquitin-like protease family profile domain-containing protein n=1 Tax=Rhododendron griersonianum TaxID=479676 RepID=A0AAV6L4M2_9ERIC|nr:hypothetical protein RHGRI_003340 [Rhododendron griersonianum]
MTKRKHEDIKKSEQKAKKESPKPVQNKKAANDKGKKKTVAYKITYRSNFRPIIKLMEKINPKLRDEHIEGLKLTRFWLLFHALLNKKLNINKCRKYDETIVQIIRTYQACENQFKIGQKLLKLTKHDIRLIFGLCCGDKHMDLAYASKESIDLVKRRKIKPKRLTATGIKAILYKALKGNGKEDVEDVVRLLCMYLCCTLFFSKPGTKIGWVYLHYMHDLKSMKDYDWCEAIRYTLMNSIEKYQLQPEKASGCVITLLYWLCEHTTILGAENGEVYPRLLKWNILELQSKIRERPFDSLLDEEVSDAELRQTTWETSFYGSDNNSMHEEGTEKLKNENKGLIICELQRQISRLGETVSELTQQVNLLNKENSRLGTALGCEPVLTRSFNDDVLYNLLTLADRNKLDNISRKRTDRHVPFGVIDAYAKTLVHGSTEPQNASSYVCRSRFWQALRIKDQERRRDIIKEQWESGLHYRYLHFPIHHKFHWTLLVHDKNEGTWKHYNSLRPSKGTDGHCKVATLMKKCICDYLESINSELFQSQKPSGKVESVKDAPQQGVGTFDSGVVVCNNMKQYFQHGSINSILPSKALDNLRVEMVTQFLNDPWSVISETLDAQCGRVEEQSQVPREHYGSAVPASSPADVETCVSPLDVLVNAAEVLSAGFGLVEDQSQVPVKKPKNLIAEWDLSFRTAIYTISLSTKSFSPRDLGSSHRTSFSPRALASPSSSSRTLARATSKAHAVPRNVKWGSVEDW